MPHFVVTERHGKPCFAVERFYSPFKADGSKRWPVVFEAIEISEYIASAYSLDELIKLYTRGIRPKPKPAPKLALPAPDKPALSLAETAVLLTNAHYGKMAGPPQPRNMLEMG